MHLSATIGGGGREGVTPRNPQAFAEQRLQTPTQEQYFSRKTTNREIYVYCKWRSSWEFFGIENKQIKTVPNDSYG